MLLQMESGGGPACVVPNGRVEEVKPVLFQMESGGGQACVVPNGRVEEVKPVLFQMGEWRRSSLVLFCHHQ